MSVPVISALPTAPSTASPSTFSANMDAFLAALVTMRTEANAMAAYIDALLAGAANVGNATTLLGKAWTDALTLGPTTIGRSKQVAGVRTAGVTTSAVTIHVPNSPACSGGLALVNGRDAGGVAFIDGVTFLSGSTVWTPAVAFSAAQYGAPAARTYTGGYNILKLTMASGTYTIDVAATEFLT